jgi:hypothetical protein
MRSDCPRRAEAILAISLALLLANAHFVYAASAGDLCVALGLCDPPPPETYTIDIICDRTAKCTEETLAVTVDDGLKFIAPRPGSQLRLSMMGRRVTDVKQIAACEVPVDNARASKAKAASEVRFVEREKPRILAAAQLAMAGRMPTRSPIAETLTVVAWAEVRTDHRIIIFLTDCREESDVGDLICERLPDEDTWLRTLAARRLLAPKSLDEVAVHFAYMAVTAVEGRKCPVSIARETAIRALWKASVERAGGVAKFTTGPAHLTEVKGGASR